MLRSPPLPRQRPYSASLEDKHAYHYRLPTEAQQLHHQLQRVGGHPPNPDQRRLTPQARRHSTGFSRFIQSRDSYHAQYTKPAIPAVQITASLPRMLNEKACRGRTIHQICLSLSFAKGLTYTG